MESGLKSHNFLMADYFDPMPPTRTWHKPQETGDWRKTSNPHRELSLNDVDSRPDRSVLPFVLEKPLQSTLTNPQTSHCVEATTVEHAGYPVSPFSNTSYVDPTCFLPAPYPRHTSNILSRMTMSNVTDSRESNSSHHLSPSPKPTTAKHPLLCSLLGLEQVTSAPYVQNTSEKQQLGCFQIPTQNSERQLHKSESVTQVSKTCSGNRKCRNQRYKPRTRHPETGTQNFQELSHQRSEIKVKDRSSKQSWHRHTIPCTPSPYSVNSLENQTKNPMLASTTNAERFPQHARAAVPTPTSAHHRMIITSPRESSHEAAPASMASSLKLPEEDPESAPISTGCTEPSLHRLQAAHQRSRVVRQTQFYTSSSQRSQEHTPFLPSQGHSSVPQKKQVHLPRSSPQQALPWTPQSDKTLPTSLYTDVDELWKSIERVATHIIMSVPVERQLPETRHLWLQLFQAMQEIRGTLPDPRLEPQSREANRKAVNLTALIRQSPLADRAVPMSPSMGQIMERFGLVQREMYAVLNKLQPLHVKSERLMFVCKKVRSFWLDSLIQILSLDPTSPNDSTVAWLNGFFKAKTDLLHLLNLSGQNPICGAPQIAPDAHSPIPDAHRPAQDVHHPKTDTHYPTSDAQRITSKSFMALVSMSENKLSPKARQSSPSATEEFRENPQLTKPKRRYKKSPLPNIHPSVYLTSDTENTAPEASSHRTETVITPPSSDSDVHSEQVRKASKSSPRSTELQEDRAEDVKPPPNFLFPQFSCPVCSTLCTTEFCLRNHLQEHHTDVNTVNCTLCSQSVQKLNLFRHLSAVHLSSQQPYVCGGVSSPMGWKCSFTTGEPSELQRHMELNHSSEFSFDCYKCLLDMSSVSEVTAHHQSAVCYVNAGVFGQTRLVQEIKVEKDAPVIGEAGISSSRDCPAFQNHDAESRKGRHCVPLADNPTDLGIPGIFARSEDRVDCSHDVRTEPSHPTLTSTREAMCRESKASTHDGIVKETPHISPMTPPSSSAEVMSPSSSSSHSWCFGDSEIYLKSNGTEERKEEKVVSPQVKEQFECYFCGVTLPSEALIKRHLRGNHRDEDELLGRKQSSGDTFALQKKPVRRRSSSTSKSKSSKKRKTSKRSREQDSASPHCHSSEDKRPSKSKSKTFLSKSSSSVRRSANNKNEKFKIRVVFKLRKTAHKENSKTTDNESTQQSHVRSPQTAPHDSLQPAPPQRLDRDVFDAKTEDERESVCKQEPCQEFDKECGTDQAPLTNPSTDLLTQVNDHDKEVLAFPGLRFRCSECPYITTHLFHFRVHLAQHATVTENVVPATPCPSRPRCGICGYIAYNQDDFIDHVNGHALEKCFLCCRCQEDFNSMEAVLSHCNSEHPDEEVLCTHRGELYRKLLKEPQRIVLMNPTVLLSELE